jgi:hypothetical protein
MGAPARAPIARGGPPGGPDHGLWGVGVGRGVGGRGGVGGGGAPGAAPRARAPPGAPPPTGIRALASWTANS